MTRPLAKYDWPRERTASLKLARDFLGNPHHLFPLGPARSIRRGGRSLDPTGATATTHRGRLSGLTAS